MNAETTLPLKRKKAFSLRVIYDSVLGVTLKAITSYEWILYARAVSVSTTFCQVLQQKCSSRKSIISYALEGLCVASSFVCACMNVCAQVPKNY